MGPFAGADRRLAWAVNLAVLFLVVLWTVPTAGLFVSAFRDRDQIAASGWWTALTATPRTVIVRSAPPLAAVVEDGRFVLSGNVFGTGSGEVTAFGVTSLRPAAFRPGATARRKSATVTVAADGRYRIVSAQAFTGRRGIRLFVEVVDPPRATLGNVETVLFSEGIGRSFLNTMTVAVPATVIPILVAAFAAYALAWMRFPGRALLAALVVGLLVVPLQLALIPLLQLHNAVGIGKTFFGIWLAHTGFGMPLAIYILRNYIAGLPREIIESARLDGASEFQIFYRIVMPLSFPALAGFAILQFLWVWNDLLIATVFLGTADDQLVMTGRLRELLGSRGGDWEILAASAVVSIAVPLAVFFALQTYLVRGLLAGSVKGG